MKKTILITLVTGSHVVLFAQYRGGANDGLATATALNQNPLHNIYGGGNNDGIGSLTVFNQNQLHSIYSGGVNDGISVTVVFNQNPLHSIYAGGNNDGIGSLNVFNQNQLHSIYAGGNNDGINSILVIAQNPLTNIYHGGANDGYAVAFIYANPLPVRLTEFRAQWQQANAHLWWNVDMEDNNDRFEIERSTNGTDFVKAGIVQSLGNTNSPRRYEFTDQSVSNIQGNVFYYRLKQVDKDGKSTYSAIVILKRDEPAFTLAVFPNPSSGVFTLRIDHFEGLRYQVYNLNGQLLLSNPIKGNNTLINLGNRPSGTYMVAVLKENKLIHQLKIILLK